MKIKALRRILWSWSTALLPPFAEESGKRRRAQAVLQNCKELEVPTTFDPERVAVFWEKLSSYLDSGNLEDYEEAFRERLHLLAGRRAAG